MLHSQPFFYYYNAVIDFLFKRVDSLYIRRTVSRQKLSLYVTHFSFRITTIFLSLPSDTSTARRSLYHPNRMESFSSYAVISVQLCRGIRMVTSSYHYLLNTPFDLTQPSKVHSRRMMFVHLFTAFYIRFSVFINKCIFFIK